MELIDSITAHALTEAGWFPERCIAINKMVGILQAQSIAVFPTAATFFHAFGDLHVRIYDAHHRVSDTLALGAFDYGCGYLEWLHDYQSFLGTTLCPVGNFNSCHFDVYISPNETFYGTFDETIFVIGTGSISAIANIVHLRDWRKNHKVLRK
ncbi:MAG: SUKH-3 domain-containing protein [Chloroflexota bacterium]